MGSYKDSRSHFVGARLRAIRPEHAVAVETLPKLHGDPFDRMLVAQAAIEPLHLITHDRIVARYARTIQLV